MRQHPFGATTTWKNVLNPIMQYSVLLDEHDASEYLNVTNAFIKRALWCRKTLRSVLGDIFWRHTIESVRDQLNLPPRHYFNILATLGPVETEYYNKEAATASDDLNSICPETARVHYEVAVVRWLSRLRRCCCHPLITNNSAVSLGKRKRKSKAQAEGVEANNNDQTHDRDSAHSLYEMMSRLVDKQEEVNEQVEKILCDAHLDCGVSHLGTFLALLLDGNDTDRMIWNSSSAEFHLRFAWQRAQHVRIGRDRYTDEKMALYRWKVMEGQALLHLLYLYATERRTKATAIGIQLLRGSIFDFVLSDARDKRLVQYVRKASWFYDQFQVDISGQFHMNVIHPQLRKLYSIIRKTTGTTPDTVKLNRTRALYWFHNEWHSHEVSELPQELQNVSGNPMGYRLLETAKGNIAESKLPMVRYTMQDVLGGDQFLMLPPSPGFQVYNQCFTLLQELKEKHQLVATYLQWAELYHQVYHMLRLKGLFCPNAKTSTVNEMQPLFPNVISSRASRNFIQSWYHVNAVLKQTMFFSCSNYDESVVLPSSLTAYVKKMNADGQVPREHFEALNNVGCDIHKFVYTNQGTSSSHMKRMENAFLLLRRLENDKGSNIGWRYNKISSFTSPNGHHKRILAANKVAGKCSIHNLPSQLVKEGDYVDECIKEEWPWTVLGHPSSWTICHLKDYTAELTNNVQVLKILEDEFVKRGQIEKIYSEMCVQYESMLKQLLDSRVISARELSKCLELPSEEECVSQLYASTTDRSGETFCQNFVAEWLRSQCPGKYTIRTRIEEARHRLSTKEKVKELEQSVWDEGSSVLTGSVFREMQKTISHDVDAFKIPVLVGCRGATSKELMNIFRRAVRSELEYSYRTIKGESRQWNDGLDVEDYISEEECMNLMNFTIGNYEQCNRDVTTRFMQSFAKLLSAIIRLKGENRRYQYLNSKKLIVSQYQASEIDVDENATELQCQICCSPPLSPMLLPCGHVICDGCWERYLASICATCLAKVPCPTCKMSFRTGDVYKSAEMQQGVTGYELGITRVPLNDMETTMMSTPAMLDTSEVVNMRIVSDPKSIYGTKTHVLVKRIINLPRNEKSLVFTQWRSMIHILEHSLRSNRISFVTLKGNSAAKSKALSKFLDDSDTSPKVMIICSDTDASGLNLVNARHVFLVEPSEDPSIEEQAIGRVHRGGQQRDCYIYRLLVSGSVEEHVYFNQVRHRFGESFVQRLENIHSKLVEESNSASGATPKVSTQSQSSSSCIALGSPEPVHSLSLLKQRRLSLDKVLRFSESNKSTRHHPAGRSQLRSTSLRHQRIQVMFSPLKRPQTSSSVE